MNLNDVRYNNYFRDNELEFQYTVITNSCTKVPTLRI